MEAYAYTRVETRLTNLLDARRLRFRFLEPMDGTFSWSYFPLILLNTLGDCLNFPVLFYIRYHSFVFKKPTNNSYYALRVYAIPESKSFDFISVLFFAAAISILLDIFIGYFFGLNKFIEEF